MQGCATRPGQNFEVVAVGAEHEHRTRAEEQVCTVSGPGGSQEQGRGVGEFFHSRSPSISVFCAEFLKIIVICAANRRCWCINHLESPQLAGHCWLRLSPTSIIDNYVSVRSPWPFLPRVHSLTAIQQVFHDSGAKNLPHNIL